jgi:hypothetical protein
MHRPWFRNEILSQSRRDPAFNSLNSHMSSAYPPMVPESFRLVWFRPPGSTVRWGPFSVMLCRASIAPECSRPDAKFGGHPTWRARPK